MSAGVRDVQIYSNGDNDNDDDGDADNNGNSIKNARYTISD